jgi:deoxyhypusine monooxygenase
MALNDESSLLAHEAAFSLGQMQDPESIPALQTTLQGIKEFHPIVRHEAAEALGAIGSPECLELLQKALVNDPALEVRETCDLALHRIEQVQAKDLEEQSPFCTVDPAVAASSSSSVVEMRKKLLDEKEKLHERYAALFGLRNRGGNEAVAAIIASLKCQSALLKHEVAYVLGQLQDKVSTDALISTLKDVTEHPMVRHEAAEALGSIADERSVELLQIFSTDSEPIVAQSCEVALHMLELEQQGKPFELGLDKGE